MTRPRRISMGCYAVERNGHQVIIQRCWRPRGFQIIHRRGCLSPVIKRLRDAAVIALESINPWPFTVEKKPDLDLDMPKFLDRRHPAP